MNEFDRSATGMSEEPLLLSKAIFISFYLLFYYFIYIFKGDLKWNFVVRGVTSSNPTPSPFLS